MASVLCGQEILKSEFLLPNEGEGEGEGKEKRRLLLVFIKERKAKIYLPFPFPLSLPLRSVSRFKVYPQFFRNGGGVHTNTPWQND